MLIPPVCGDPELRFFGFGGGVGKPPREQNGHFSDLISTVNFPARANPDRKSTENRPKIDRKSTVIFRREQNPTENRPKIDRKSTENRPKTTENDRKRPKSTENDRKRPRPSPRFSTRQVSARGSDVDGGGGPAPLAWPARPDPTCSVTPDRLFLRLAALASQGAGQSLRSQILKRSFGAELKISCSLGLFFGANVKVS